MATSLITADSPNADEGCPSRERLASLLDGSLSEADSAELGRHVDGCLNCQRMLDEICASPVLGVGEETEKPLSSSDRSAVNRLLDEMRQRPELTSLQSSSVRKGDEPAASTFELPMRLKDYELQELIGEGATGCLYRALDLSLGRSVAVKVLKPQFARGSATWQRFVREARSAAALRSDHVVTVFVVDEGDALTPPFLVMEFVAGGSLAKRVRSVPLRTGVEWVVQTARGLTAAHAADVVHRDIKPSNLLFDEVAGRVKLADFGLARWEDASEQLTAAGMLAGTPSYMSPEQITDPSSADALSDLYSLGVVLYEVLTHELPFRGTTRRVLEQVLHDEPTAPRLLNDGVSRDLETVCLKAMSKDRSFRYGSAAEFADDLQRWLDGLPVVARPIGPLRRGWRWLRRNPKAAGAGFIVSLVLAGGFVDWFGRRTSTTSPAAATTPERAGANAAPTVAPEEINQRDRIDYLRLLASIAEQSPKSPEQFAARAKLLDEGLNAVDRWPEPIVGLPLDVETAKLCCGVGESAFKIGRVKIAEKLATRALEVARQCVRRDSNVEDRRTLLRCQLLCRDVADERLHWQRREAWRLEAFELATSLLAEAVAGDAVSSIADVAGDWSRAAEGVVAKHPRDAANGWERTVESAIEKLMSVEPSKAVAVDRALALLESRLAASCCPEASDARRGHWQQAASRFERLLSVEPTSTTLFIDAAESVLIGLKSNVLSLRSDESTTLVERALQHVGAAIELDPTDMRSHRLRAELSLQLAQSHSRSAKTDKQIEALELAANDFEAAGPERLGSRLRAISALADRAFAETKRRGGHEAIRESLSRIERLLADLEGRDDVDAESRQVATDEVGKIRTRCSTLQKLLQPQSVR